MARATDTLRTRHAWGGGPCQYAGVLARYPATVAALDGLLERGTGAPVQLQGAYGAFRPLMTAGSKPRAS